jgi:hypothetical protein
MRRLLTSLGLAAGALAFWRWRLRHRRPVPAVEDPAKALKRKLAESRSDEPPAAPAPEGATTPEPGEPQTSLDERRRAVHDRARQAIDEMLGGENLPGEESD